MGDLRTIRVGVVGLGGRGRDDARILLNVPGVVIPCVCDVVEERVRQGIEVVKSNSGDAYPVTGYSDYREMFEKEKLDAVLCATTWITHARVAVAAMNAGLDVGIEVGGAASERECWDMVRTSERTGKFCMMLVNCCYDRNEMLVWNMHRHGLFGTLIHCEGGYRHDLRDEISLGRENIHGRLYNFQRRNGELYPTHELGPLCKLLGINRGNRLLYLTSMASKGGGLNRWIKDNKGADYDLADYPFNEGDVVTTMIKCANGETITLNHDCSLPRFYSRDYMVQGTKGLFTEREERVWLDRVTPRDDDVDCEKTDIEYYRSRYEHPLWKKYIDDGEKVRLGHGGMDYFVECAFAESVRERKAPPIDVYDTALWMAITYLSEQSVAMGSMPVPIPDFTDGMWIDREPYERGMYCLSEICDDFFEEKR